jgi:hypothetical protein
MSRAADGTYTLPVGSMNPAVTGTAISSTDFNALADDIEAALTDSLSRSGKGGMTAAMTFDAGSNAAPGITFTGDLDTGIFSPAANEIGISLGGAEVAHITAASTVLPPLTKASMAAVGQVVSTSSGFQHTHSLSYTDLSNLAVTITTTGRPVMVMLQPDGGGVPMELGCLTVSAVLPGSANLCLYRGATIAEFASASLPASYTGSAGFPAISFVDVVVAGTYTYKVRGMVSDADVQLFVNYAKLVAFEL